MYVISKPAGTFTIPGPTTATVAGTGKLEPKRSTAGYQEHVAITEAHAALYHDEVGTVFR